jgi:hypothetical protein
VPTPSPAFAYRRFFGDYRAQREVGPLAPAELRPTAPEHDVREHTHEDAHKPSMERVSSKF